MDHGSMDHGSVDHGSVDYAVILKCQVFLNLNIVYCIPLYLMVLRDYQNNCTNDRRRPSFVLFLN